jgi:hypothetical protein
MCWGIFACSAENAALEACIPCPSGCSEGKAYFKQQIAGHVVLNPAILPYREDVLQFLTREKAQGRDIVLATGSDRKLQPAQGELVDRSKRI